MGEIALENGIFPKDHCPWHFTFAKGRVMVWEVGLLSHKQKWKSYIPWHTRWWNVMSHSWHHNPQTTKGSIIEKTKTHKSKLKTSPSSLCEEPLFRGYPVTSPENLPSPKRNYFKRKGSSSHHHFWERTASFLGEYFPTLTSTRRGSFMDLCPSKILSIVMKGLDFCGIHPECIQFANNTRQTTRNPHRKLSLMCDLLTK